MSNRCFATPRPPGDIGSSQDEKKSDRRCESPSSPGDLDLPVTWKAHEQRSERSLSRGDTNPSSTLKGRGRGSERPSSVGDPNPTTTIVEAPGRGSERPSSVGDTNPTTTIVEAPGRGSERPSSRGGTRTTTIVDVHGQGSERPSSVRDPNPTIMVEAPGRGSERPSSCGGTNPATKVATRGRGSERPSSSEDLNPVTKVEACQRRGESPSLSDDLDLSSLWSSEESCMVGVREAYNRMFESPSSSVDLDLASLLSAQDLYPLFAIEKDGQRGDSTLSHGLLDLSLCSDEIYLPAIWKECEGPGVSTTSPELLSESKSVQDIRRELSGDAASDEDWELTFKKAKSMGQESAMEKERKRQQKEEDKTMCRSFIQEWARRRKESPRHKDQEEERPEQRWATGVIHPTVLTDPPDLTSETRGRLQKRQQETDSPKGLMSRVHAWLKNRWTKTQTTCNVQSFNEDTMQQLEPSGRRKCQEKGKEVGRDTTAPADSVRSRLANVFRSKNRVHVI